MTSSDLYNMMAILHSQHKNECHLSHLPGQSYIISPCHCIDKKNVLGEDDVHCI